MIFHPTRTTVLLLTLALVFLAVAIATVSYYQTRIAQAQSNTGNQATPSAPVLPSTPDVEPLNSTWFSTIGERTTVTASWGTLTVEAETAPESGAAGASSNSGSATRAVNAIGQDDVTRHRGLAKVLWDSTIWNAHRPADRSITGYLVERRYYFPDDHGPSEYETLVALHPHHTVNTNHQYNDYNVASRSVYEYRITPKLDNNTWLEPALARVNSAFRGNIEGYGVNTGIQLHINYATTGILEDQEVRMYRITYSAGGQQLVTPDSLFHTVDPATERISHIDTGVTKKTRG